MYLKANTNHLDTPITRSTWKAKYELKILQKIQHDWLMIQQFKSSFTVFDNIFVTTVVLFQKGKWILGYNVKNDDLKKIYQYFSLHKNSRTFLEQQKKDALT